MKVLIEIDDKDYADIMSDSERNLNHYERLIKKGVPLPKGHGRLIDADALVKKMEEREEKLKDDKSMWETAGVETALDMFAQTIIEADKGDTE